MKRRWVPLSNPGFPKFRKKTNLLTLFCNLNLARPLPLPRPRLNNARFNALWLEQLAIYLFEIKEEEVGLILKIF